MFYSHSTLQYWNIQYMNINMNTIHIHIGIPSLYSYCTLVL